MEVMLEYCANDAGWYYEPEACWSLRVSEIEIARVGIDGASLWENTPLLGDRNVIVEITPGAFNETVKMMVTELTFASLNASLGGSVLPTMYGNARSDYILIRPTDASVNTTSDMITIRIPFDVTLFLDGANGGFNPSAYQLAFLDETHGVEAADWEPHAGTVTYYARNDVPSDWPVSNATSRYGASDRFGAGDLPFMSGAPNSCPRSFDTNYLCPVSPGWSTVFASRSNELDQSFLTTEFDSVYYAEATVSRFGVYAVMELGYSVFGYAEISQTRKRSGRDEP
jgi:hypothetical protein